MGHENVQAMMGILMILQRMMRAKRESPREGERKTFRVTREVGGEETDGARCRRTAVSPARSMHGCSLPRGKRP